MNIVFYGNCQLVALRLAYDTYVRPHTGDTTSSVNPRVTPSSAEWSAIEQADLVIDQVTDLGVENALDTATPRCRRISVPQVGTPFLWPWTGTPHPQSTALYGAYHPFRAEMNDTWVLRAIKSGASPDQAVADYLALDAAAAGHVQRRYEIEMDRQRARDRATGFDAASLIEAHFRTERLFLTPYHPTARIARYMAETTFERIGVPSHCLDLLRRTMTISFGLRFELPVHPAIASHFGLTWAGEHTRYRFYQEGLLTFAQHIERVAHCRADPDLEAALSAVHRNTPDAPALMEAAYRRAADAPWPAPWARRAMGIVRMRQGRLAEAETLLRAAAAEHDEDNFWGALSDCLRQANRLPEAVDAMRREAARAPYHAQTHFTFALLLARAGHRDEAVREVDLALELAPGTERFRMFRDKLLTQAKEAVLS